MLEIERRILQNSLWEIEAALRTEGFPLVALSETTVCFTGCLQGRWRCSWWKISSLGQPLPPIAHTLATLGRLFDRAVAELTTIQEKYLDAESRSLSSDLPRLRQRIVDLSGMLFPFWESFIKESTIFPGKEIFLSLLGPTRFLLDRVTFSVLQPLPIWVEIEAHLQQEVPLSLLFKLRDSQNLSALEKKTLLAWAKELQKIQGLTPARLTLFLESIESFANSRPDCLFSLPHLLLFFDRHGIKKWMEKDILHLHWRMRLKEGAQLKMKDRQLTLGKPLEEERPDNRYRHFFVKEMPDCLIRSGSNRLVNRFEPIARDSLQFGIRSMKTISLDGEGRFQLVQKLTQSLLSHTWKSKEWQLLPEEERLAAMLANHLIHQVEGNFSLEGVHLKDLFLDGSPPVLRASCLIRKKSACYLAWETFARLLAKENGPVLHFIVHVSQLSSHSLYRYFQGIGSFSLRTGKTNLLSSPLPKDWEGPSYTLQAETLAASALQIRKQTIERMQLCSLENDTPMEETLQSLEKRVANLLVTLYQAHPTPSILPSDLLQEVERRWSEKKELSIKGLTGSSAYYLEKQKEVQLRNRKSAP